MVPSTSRILCCQLGHSSSEPSIADLLPDYSALVLSFGQCSTGLLSNTVLIAAYESLRLRLDLRPDVVHITCEALGLHLAQATQVSSSDIVLDLVALFNVSRWSPHPC